jgi:hypothetical protein
MGGHVAHTGDMRNAYKILVEKSEGKRSLLTPSLRCEDNITMNLKVIGWEVLDWIHLAQNRDLKQALVNTVMNLQVP